MMRFHVVMEEVPQVLADGDTGFGQLSQRS